MSFRKSSFTQEGMTASGSFSGTFVGDGVGIVGGSSDTASYVAGANVDGIVALATSASDAAFDDIRDKPSLFSASIQVDHDATTNFEGTEHFLQSAITEVGTVVTGDVDAILPVGTLSASAQIKGQLDVTGITGSLLGTASWADDAVTASFALNAGGGDFLPLAGGTLTGDLVMSDSGTLVIKDSTNADSASFSHDGTDFNLVLSNTNDYNITGMTNVKIGGILQVDSPRIIVVDVTPRLRLNETDADADEKFWDIRSAGGQLQFAMLNDAQGDSTTVFQFNRVGLTGSIVTWTVPQMTINAASDDATVLILGESSTPRGTSQDSRIDMWSEAAGSVQHRWRLSAGGANMGLSRDTAGGAFQFSNANIELIDVDLRIRDTALDSDGVFSHDGTDFNLLFTGTTDYNISGLTSLVVSANINIPNDTGRFNAGASNDLSMYHDGTDSWLINTGPGRLFIYQNSDERLLFYTSGSERAEFQAGGDFLTFFNVLHKGGKLLRVENTAGDDFGQWQHDGTDFNLAFTNTTDYNITGYTGFVKLDAELVVNEADNALVVDLPGMSGLTIRNTPVTASVITGLWLQGNEGSSGFDAGLAIQFGNWQTSEKEFTSRIVHYGKKSATRATQLAFDVHTGTEDVWHEAIRIFGNGSPPHTELRGDVYIIDDGLTDWGAWSHDGTDFNLAFTNTTDYNITGLGGSLKIDGVAVLTAGSFVAISGDTMTGPLLISESRPRITFLEDGAPVDEGRWTFDYDGGSFAFTAVNDAVDTAANIFTVTRTGTTVDIVNFQSTNLQHGGTDVSLDGHTHPVSEISDFDPTDYLLLTGGTLTGALTMSTGDNIVPATNDGSDLGTTALRWGVVRSNVFHAFGESAFNYQGPHDTGTIILNMGLNYAWYADDTGAGTDDTRVWFDTPDRGELVLGPRSGANFLDQVRIRSRRVTFESDVSASGAGTKEVEFDLDVQIKSGHFLQILDSGNTDHVVWKHDGTDFFLTATNTAAYRIIGMDSLVLQPNNRVDLQGGTPLRIRDGTDSDYAEWSHDGTDFNLLLVATTDYNITNLTGQLFVSGNLQLNTANPKLLISNTLGNADAKMWRMLAETGNGRLVFATRTDADGAGENWLTVNRTGTAITIISFQNANSLKLTDGIDFYIQDASNVGRAVWDHDGTDFNLDFVATTDYNITNLSGSLKIDGVAVLTAGSFVAISGDTMTGDLIMGDGAIFAIQDAGNTDSASFSHDGTDFRIEFNNTGVVRMIGHTGDFLVFGNGIRILNNREYKGRNQADSLDFGLIKLNTTDIVELDPDTQGLTMPAASQIGFQNFTKLQISEGPSGSRWLRVGEINASGGRGTGRFHIAGQGGNITPFNLIFHVTKDWLGQSGINIIHAGGGVGEISSIRLAHNTGSNFCAVDVEINSNSEAGFLSTIYRDTAMNAAGIYVFTPVDWIDQGVGDPAGSTTESVLIEIAIDNNLMLAASTDLGQTFLVNDQLSFNRGAAANSDLVLGEESVLRGDAQDSRIRMLAENAGVISDVLFDMRGANLLLSSDFAAFTFQIDTDMEVLAGGFLRVRDSTNNDRATWTHDGTDFNLAFTNTTDYNITGLTNLNVGGTAVSLEGHDHTVSEITDFDPTDYLLLTGGTLTGDVTMSNSLLMESAIRIAYAAPRLRWTETDASANNGEWDIVVEGESMLYRVLNDAGGAVTYMEVTRTGTLVNGINLQAQSMNLNAEADAATTLRIGETSTLRGNSQDGRLILYGENAGVIGGMILNHTGTNLQFTTTAGASNVQFFPDARVEVLSGKILGLRDSTQVDTAYWNHDGTDFNLVFTGTADYNITGLTGALKVDTDIAIPSDSGKFLAGASADLEMYHDASNSYLLNNTGILNIYQVANERTDFYTNNSLAMTIQANHQVDMKNGAELQAGSFVVWSGTLQMGRAGGSSSGLASFRLGTSTGGWARGWHYYDSGSNIIGGIGVLGSNQLMTHAYMGYGANPHQSSEALIIRPGVIQFEDTDVSLAGHDHTVSEITDFDPTDYLLLTGGTITGVLAVSGTNPQFRIQEGDAPTDEGWWEHRTAAGSYVFRTVNDANSVAATIFSVTRTGTVVDIFNIQAATLQHNGTDVALEVMTTNGDILYYNSGRQRLAKGSDDEVLTLVSGIPAWVAGGSGIANTISTSAPSGGGSTGDIWCRI